MDHYTIDILRCKPHLSFHTWKLITYICQWLEGRAIPIADARHRSTTGSFRCTWFVISLVRVSRHFTQSSPFKQSGFVLAGVPVYYLTRRPDSEGASHIQTILCRFFFPSTFSCKYDIYEFHTAPFSSIVSRLRGAGLARAGFERVATAPEGEGVELSESRGSPRL